MGRIGNLRPGDVGFYLIQNANISTWRSQNSANSLNPTGTAKPVAFFSFQAANPDGFDHLQASFASDNANNANGNGKLTLGWEDMTNGGDKDFDDIVFTATGFKSAGTTTTTGTTLFTYDANASDADGDTITFGLSSAPQGATINAQTGIITWSPSAAGSYSFSVTAADGKGGTTTQAFTLTVNAPVVNSAPVALADSASTNEDTSVIINVLANDQDANGDALSATVVTGPQHGTLVKNADGSFSYTPTKDWYGTDSFTYLASDGNANSNVATVTITVKPVNDAPIASNASYTVKKDGSVKIDLRSLASDVDGDTLTITLTNPTKGTLTKNADGTYTYKPNKGYTGNDSFSYTVSDGKLTATGTISLKVASNVESCQTSGTAATAAATVASTASAKTASSASIVVTSSAQSTSPASSSADEQDIHYVVINSGAQGSSAPALAPVASTTSAPAINWGGSGAAASLAGGSPPPSQANNWLSQLLADNQASAPVDLGQTTGLKVKL
jgi:VCBS repeat-containing protein